MRTDSKFALFHVKAMIYMKCSSVQDSSDKLVSEVLSEMPLLESLSVWQGSALKNTGEIIHKYCPEFKRLTVYLWYVVLLLLTLTSEVLMVSH